MKKLLLVVILLLLTGCGNVRKYRAYTTSLAGSSYVKSNSYVMEIDDPSYIEDSTVLSLSDSDDELEFDDEFTSNPLVKNNNESENKNIKEVKNTLPIIVNKEVSVGRLLYRIPDTMKLFTNYRVTVRISKSMSSKKMSNGISGKCISSKIPVTYKMDISIKDESPDDDKSFKINQINSSQQIVDSIGYTEWVFNIQPIKNGDKKLNLIVSIIKNGDKKEIVYTDTIYVKDNIKKSVSTFWGKYWQWFMSTLIIPFIVFLYKKKKKEE